MAQTSEDALAFLTGLAEEERIAIGERARKRVLAEHTAALRARRSPAQPRLSAVRPTSQA